MIDLILFQSITTMSPLKNLLEYLPSIFANTDCKIPKPVSTDTNATATCALKMITPMLLFTLTGIADRDVRFPRPDQTERRQTRLVQRRLQLLRRNRRKGWMDEWTSKTARTEGGEASAWVDSPHQYPPYAKHSNSKQKNIAYFLNSPTYVKFLIGQKPVAQHHFYYNYSRKKHVSIKYTTYVIVIILLSVLFCFVIFYFFHFMVYKITA